MATRTATWSGRDGEGNVKTGTVSVTVNTTPPPVSKTVFGSCLASDGSSLTTKISNMENLFGNVKAFRSFDGGKGPSGAWTRDGASLLPASVLIQLSYKASPSSISSGSLDSALVGLWKSYPSRIGAIYETWYHECEDNIKAGEFTAAEYRAAWKHILDLRAATSGITKPSIFAPTLMAYTLQAASGRNVADYEIPGVTAVGFDAYSEDQVQRSMAYAKAKGYALLISEFGHDQKQSVQTDDQMVAYFNLIDPQWANYPPVAVMYFNATVGGQHPLDNRPKAAALWKSYCDR